jgi:putative SOS response-associated peptidase YedK
MEMRYVIPEQDAVERELAPARKWWRFSASFNAAPQRQVPAVRLHERESEGVMLRWGLIAAWAKGDPAKCERPWALREELPSLELVRSAWLNAQRCLLPLGGFYIWERTPAGYRQPYFVYGRAHSVLAMLGVWERSCTDEDDVIESCLILTVPASAELAQLGPGFARMPAILRREDFATWLNGTPAAAQRLLEALPTEPLAVHRVSPRVNSPREDDSRLVEALE